MKYSTELRLRIQPLNSFPCEKKKNIWYANQNALAIVLRIISIKINLNEKFLISLPTVKGFGFPLEKTFP
jgi:hypothetical protein